MKMTPTLIAMIIRVMKMMNCLIMSAHIAMMVVMYWGMQVYLNFKLFFDA